MSQQSSQAIQETLSKLYSSVIVTSVNNYHDLEELIERSPDMVFLGMKFIPANPEIGFQDPEKIWIADYLDFHGIAYTGSNHLAHQLELYKPKAKQRVLDNGLDTSPFITIRRNKLFEEEKMSLDYPVFIKPCDRGGGKGIDSQSVALNFDQLLLKVASITDMLESDSLIEEYLPGREFSVAVLKNEFSPGYSVMPIELVAPADDNGVRVLSEHVKTADAETVLDIADEGVKTKVSQLAINVFESLGCRDYGRIDIRLDSNGVPQFLEANLLPSLIAGYGSFPKACVLNLKLNYEDMILKIVRLAFLHNVPALFTKLLTTMENLPELEPTLEPA